MKKRRRIAPPPDAGMKSQKENWMNSAVVKKTGLLPRMTRYWLVCGLALTLQTGWSAEQPPAATWTSGDVPVTKEKKQESKPFPMATAPNFDAAKEGNAAAQFNLGVCYEEGSGVATNYVEAVRWFRKAADQGYAAAQCHLGTCYLQGEGVVEDDTEAVQWYRRAAEQRNATAQFNLGGCFASGKGVVKNAAEAVAWYRRAAEQGFAKAQYNLAVCLETGFGVSQDPFAAVKWYHKAAEQGLAAAQRNLGVCYEKGLGVDRNIVEAYKWLSQAAAQGNTAAKQRRADLERKMTTEQIAAAQRLPDSLSLVPWSESPPGTNASSAVELTLEMSKNTFRTAEGLSFTVSFHNNTNSNLLLNGGALLGNGAQIWSGLETELKNERGERVSMTMGLGVPVTGRIYFLGLPLHAGSSYTLFVGNHDNFAGPIGVLEPGKYELRCIYHGRQSPYRDSTQLPPCWEGEARSNTLHLKVLRSHIKDVPQFFSQMWDAIR